MVNKVLVRSDQCHKADDTFLVVQGAIYMLALSSTQ